MKSEFYLSNLDCSIFRYLIELDSRDDGRVVKHVGRVVQRTQRPYRAVSVTKIKHVKCHSASLQSKANTFYPEETQRRDII